jgi:hypothetical protein
MMNTETYLERMRELGVSRGLLEREMAFPPDFGSLISMHQESPLVDRNAGWTVKAPPLEPLPESLRRRAFAVNAVAYLHGMMGRGKQVNRAVLIEEAKRRATRPLERFYVALFERGESIQTLAAAAGLSASHCALVLRKQRPAATFERVMQCVTAEERAFFGGKPALEVESNQEKTA